jgi:hypothetical protein
MAQVIPFPVKHDPEMTKRQLADLWNCSTRTIVRYMDPEYMLPRGKQPLPSFTTPFGERRFLLSQAERWRKEQAA